MNKRNYSVYWYHLKNMVSYNEGYIGITKNLKERHSSHLKNKKSKIGKILRENGDHIIRTIIASGLTRERALEMEFELVPECNMGWNIAKGGSSTNHEQETCNKIYESLQKYYKNSLSQILFNNLVPKLSRDEYLLLRKMRKLLNEDNKDYRMMTKDELFIILNDINNGKYDIIKESLCRDMHGKSMKECNKEELKEYYKEYKRQNSEDPKNYKMVINMNLVNNNPILKEYYQNNT